MLRAGGAKLNTALARSTRPWRGEESGFASEACSRPFLWCARGTKTELLGTEQLLGARWQAAEGAGRCLQKIRQRRDGLTVGLPVWRHPVARCTPLLLSACCTVRHLLNLVQS